MAATQEKQKRQVRVDARGRVTLGSAASHKDYQVTVREDGEITLTPVTRVPLNEAWFWNNPVYAAAARRGLDDAAAGRVSTPQSFAQYADLEIADE